MEYRDRQLDVPAGRLHVVENGDRSGRPVLFLHGWPESWRAWHGVMSAAGQGIHAIAIDLPGVGGSGGATTDGTKRRLAHVVHDLIAAMELRDVVLVGHDVGGMVTFAYLREYDDLAAAVIMDVALPGVPPWDEVLRNPYIWHFAMHAIPELPERLVQGRQADYFDYFFDVMSPEPGRITAPSRTEHVRAYESAAALRAGFDWYRAFPSDASDNSTPTGIRTPLLYLRGTHPETDIEPYVDGLRSAGLAHVEHALIPGAGHFSPEEAPAAVWAAIAGFAIG